jgi:O-antigen biosynthesis protein WbqV
VGTLGPSALVLLDASEYALWQIGMELEGTVPLASVIADVRDRTRLRTVFEAHRPELVFHAAALKHVPMVEANPIEGLLTNAVGTRVVADVALAAGVATMVVISTDKAVNPSSLMGASKRLAEMYTQGLHVRRAEEGGTRFVTVRFGNVLGSTGSVVPVFRRQLERGGPLTVTHRDMQRYFMTVTEAVGLVLQAAVAGAQGGTEAARQLAAGGIFVLDMGAPVRIDDLARQMIRLAGLKPDEDIAIAYTGLRPGEKLFEELFHGHEPPVPTGYPGLLMAQPRFNDAAIVGRGLDEMEAACRRGDATHARAVVERLVPEYLPSEVAA